MNLCLSRNIKVLFTEFIRKAVFKFCNVCTTIFSEVQNRAEVHKLLEETNLALVTLEKDMPVTIQVSMHICVCIHMYVDNCKQADSIILCRHMHSSCSYSYIACY